MSDDLRRRDLDELELNRFWNELVRPSGSWEPDPAKPASELAETVRQLRALSQASPPDTARERLRRGLADTLKAREASPVAEFGAVTLLRPNDLNGRVPSSQQRHDHPIEPAARRR